MTRPPCRSGRRSRYCIDARPTPIAAGGEHVLALEIRVLRIWRRAKQVGPCRGSHRRFQTWDSNRRCDRVALGGDLQREPRTRHLCRVWVIGRKDHDEHEPSRLEHCDICGKIGAGDQHRGRLGGVAIVLRWHWPRLARTLVEPSLTPRAASEYILHDAVHDKVRRVSGLFQEGKCPAPIGPAIQFSPFRM